MEVFHLVSVFEGSEMNTEIEFPLINYIFRCLPPTPTLIYPEFINIYYTSVTSIYLHEFLMDYIPINIYNFHLIHDKIEICHRH